jgi:hypothetical protein
MWTSTDQKWDNAPKGHIKRFDNRGPNTNVLASLNWKKRDIHGAGLDC